MDKEALWLIESPTCLSKCTPPFFGVCRFYKRKLTLIAPTQSPDNMLHSFTVLCENENFLISSLHCFFANVVPCPLVLLSSLTEELYHLVAILCTLSSISTSFLRYGLHACMQYSKWGLTIVLYSGIISSFFLYTIFRLINPRIWFPFAAAIHNALIPSYQLHLYIILVLIYQQIYVKAKVHK